MRGFPTPHTPPTRLRIRTDTYFYNLRGVRFDSAAAAVSFAEKLATEVSTRAKKLRVQGRCVTLKLLRAVGNVPDGMMKGTVGHGVCDHLTRSVTLSAGATREANVLCKEVAQILARLDVPASEIRGMGVQLSKLDSDPGAGKGRAGNGGRTVGRVASAGRQGEWSERDETRKNRYAAWFGKPVEDKNAKNGTSPVAKQTTPDNNRTSPRDKTNAYAAALCGGQTRILASFARGSGKPLNNSRLTQERGAPAPASDVPRSPAKRPRRTEGNAGAERGDADDTDDDTENGVDFDTHLNENETEEEETEEEEEEEPREAPVALRQAHARAARAHAFQTFSFSEKPVDSELTLTKSARLLLRDCESFLASIAQTAFREHGPDAAATVIDTARRLARAQWTTPAVAFFVIGDNRGAAAQQKRFAAAWIDACESVESEVVRAALTQ